MFPIATDVRNKYALGYTFMLCNQLWNVCLYELVGRQSTHTITKMCLCKYIKVQWYIYLLTVRLDYSTMYQQNKWHMYCTNVSAQCACTWLLEICQQIKNSINVHGNSSESKIRSGMFQPGFFYSDISLLRKVKKSNLAFFVISAYCLNLFFIAQVHTLLESTV